VFCGPSMVFTNVTNPRSHINRKSEYKRTLVRRGATLGANCTIVCGVTIGEHAFIGAGAVVTKDVPDHALMVGVPARQVGWTCFCGIQLEVQEGVGTCPACDSSVVVDLEYGRIEAEPTTSPLEEKPARTMAVAAGHD